MDGWMFCSNDILIWSFGFSCHPSFSSGLILALRILGLEISISPQNKKPEKVIFIFAKRCGFPLHQKHLYGFYLYGKNWEIFKTVLAEDSSICVCLYLYLGCSCMRLHSWGRVQNWPHDIVACILQYGITIKESCGWKECWRETQPFE